LSGPSEARSSEYGPDDLEEPSAAREVVQLRELMKNFVQEMVVGRDVTIVVEAGQTESGWLRLTPNLLALRLEAAGVSHEMLLRNIKDMRAGALNDNQGPVKLDPWLRYGFWNVAIALMLAKFLSVCVFIVEKLGDQPLPLVL
ncbi:RAB23, partial [Symbiodinium sp. KB8]